MRLRKDERYIRTSLVDSLDRKPTRAPRHKDIAAVRVSYIERRDLDGMAATRKDQVMLIR